MRSGLFGRMFSMDAGGRPPPPSPPASGGGVVGGGQSPGSQDWVKWLTYGGGGLVVLIVLVMALGGGDDTATVASTQATSSSAAATTAAATSSSEAAATTAAAATTEAAATTVGPGEAPGEIFLETAGSEGPDSFAAGEVFHSPVVSTTSTLVTTTTTSEAASTTAAGQVAVQGRAGDQPGLYGGTQDQASCDADAMLAFLQANFAKAQAWVDALNSDPDLLWGDGRTSLAVVDLEAYFAELTPVILLEDTRVTNHGFRNGLPTARQAVFQAGTAVLVDKYGVPRARCACGNPLIPPLPAPRPPVYVGPQWPGWNPVNVVIINQSVTIINQITLINVFTGDTFGRPVGTRGRTDVIIIIDTTPLTIPDDIVVGAGDLQVTVIWATDADLDLHVIDATGFELSYTQDVSPSGGQLDVDDVPDEGDAGPHVENIFWPSGGSPGGRYVAFVRHFSGAPSGYTMEVRVGGVLIHTETGSLGINADSPEFEFFVDTAASSFGTSDEEV